MRLHELVKYSKESIVLFLPKSLISLCILLVGFPVYILCYTHLAWVEVMPSALLFFFVFLFYIIDSKDRISAREYFFSVIVICILLRIILQTINFPIPIIMITMVMYFKVYSTTLSFSRKQILSYLTVVLILIALCVLRFSINGNLDFTSFLGLGMPLIIAPFFEEILFRKTMRDVCAGMNMLVRIVLMILSFAFVHYQYNHMMLGLPYYIFSSALFVLLYEWKRNLIINMLFHAVLNFIVT